MSIKQVKNKYEAQLMQLPNVTGVGTGERGGKEIIMIYVTHKLPESSLQPQEVVPKILEGFETDVEEIGFVTVQTPLTTNKLQNKGRLHETRRE